MVPAALGSGSRGFNWAAGGTSPQPSVGQDLPDNLRLRNHGADPHEPPRLQAIHRIDLSTVVGLSRVSRAGCESRRSGKVVKHKRAGRCDEVLSNTPEGPA